MNPLRVSCTTCQARLKVVDPAAIGEILSCPKCGSMVHVAAPPGWSPEPAPQTSTAWKQKVEERSSTDFADYADTKAKIGAAGGSSTGDSLVMGLGAPNNAASALPLPAAPAQALPPPPTNVEPEVVSRWFWPTMAGITLAGLIAAGVWLQLDRLHRAASDAGASGEGQAARHQPAVDDSHDVTAEHSSKLVPPASPTVDNKPSIPAKSPAPVQVATADPPAASKIAPPAPKKADPPAVKAEPPAASKVEASPKPKPAAASPAPIHSALNPPSSALNPPPLPAAAPRPSLERLAPREINVEARLADPLPGVDFQNVPLWRFVNQVSQLSTIRITLDLDQLSEMNLSVDAPVSVRLKDSTVSGVLDEALAPLGLATRLVKRQLLIGRASSAGSRLVRYAVGDLIGEKPTAEQQDHFAKLVHALVEPASWQEAGGAGTSSWSDGVLIVEQNESAHAQLLVLCEKLRVARSLPLRSHLESNRFRLEPRFERARAALAAQVTANFAHPEPLAKVLAYLGDAAHVRLLIDHAALAEEQLSSDTEAFVTAQHLPLAQALAALLEPEPLELTYRVIDEHTLQITTPRAAAARAEVEFYPVRGVGVIGGESDLAGSVRRELAAAGIPTSLLHEAAIQYDAPSRTLIVRAPQSVQMRIQAALGTLRLARQ